MTPIQLMLLGGLGLSAVLYWSKMRSKLRDRVVVFAIILFGIVLVAAPNLSNRLARALGVGRGADLVSYLGLVGGGFCLLLLFSNQRAAQSQITHLVREMAILRAEKPKGAAVSSGMADAPFPGGDESPHAGA